MVQILIKKIDCDRFIVAPPPLSSYVMLYHKKDEHIPSST